MGPLSPAQSSVYDAFRFGSPLRDPQFYKDMLANLPSAIPGVLAQGIGLPGDIAHLIHSADPQFHLKADQFPLTSDWLLKGWGLGNDRTAHIANAIPSLGPGEATGLTKAIFIGAKARGGIKELEQAATKLESEGHGPSTIYDQTGMFRGKDGNWRAEISDDKARVRNVPARTPTSGELGSFLDHPELYQAYPTLENRQVMLGHGGGHRQGIFTGLHPTPRFTPGGKAMETPSIYAEGKTLDEMREVLMHEVQHGVQEIEGWARGGSPKEFPSMRDQVMKATEDAAETLRQRGVATNINEDKAKRTIYMTGLFENGNASKLVSPDDPRVVDVIDKLNRFRPKDPYKQYQRLAGEVEARATQGRINMTPDQRAATFPEYDTPLRQQIVKSWLEPQAPVGGGSALTPIAESRERPTAVMNVFNNVTGYDDALDIARSGGHLRRMPDGHYVGAAPSIDSPQALAGMRRGVDASVARGAFNADWYLRQRDLASALSPDPKMQSLFARGTAAYSPQAMPKVELPAFLRQHNEQVLTGEDVVPRLKRQMQDVRKGYSWNAETGAVEFDPSAVKLGKKTGPYADAKDPTIPDENLYQTANDIWHARRMGWGPEFKERGLKEAQHGFLTGENLLLADRANASGLKIPGYPNASWTPRSAQAATWGDTRMEALHKKFPEKTEQELKEYASQGLDTAMPAQSAYLTNEAITGASTGHLPGMPSWLAPQKREYTKGVLDATGRDPTIEALGMYQLPPQSTVGEYLNSAGALERNPGWANPVAVSNQKAKGVGRVTPDSERTALDLSAQIGGLMRAQEAGAWSRFHAEPISGMNVGSMNALRYRDFSPQQEKQLRKMASAQGLSVIDHGDQLALTKFGDAGPALSPKELSAALHSPMAPAGVRAQRGVLETGYVPTMTGNVGTGESTLSMLKAIDSSGLKNVYERLDASRWRSVAQAMNDIDAGVAAAKNLPVREDLMKLRQIVASGGFSGLRDFVKKNGAAGLPVLAGLGLLPALSQTHPDAATQ